MQTARLALLLCLLVATAGCLQADVPGDRRPAGTATGTAPTPEPTPDAPGRTDIRSTTTTESRTTALTPDWMTPDTVLAVQSASNRSHEVTVRLVEIDTNETGRTITRQLEPGEEFEVDRAETNAPHWRVVVTVDGSVVFEETIYRSEQYWVTVHSRTNASYSSAVA